MMHKAKIEELREFAKDIGKELSLLKDLDDGILSFTPKAKKCTFNRIIFCLNEISNYIEYLKQRDDILEGNEK